MTRAVARVEYLSIMNPGTEGSLQRTRQCVCMLGQDEDPVKADKHLPHVAILA